MPPRPTEGSAEDPAEAPAGRRRIGISGSYGGINLGDESILEGLVGSLRAGTEDVELTVFTRDPEDTLRRHPVEHAIDPSRTGRPEVVARLGELDLFVLGGGGLLFDEGVETYLRELTLAQEAGIPTMTYAIGAGPLEEPASRESVRTALGRCAAVTVRDRSARRLLEEIGVEGVRLTADPALLLEPEPIPEEALEREGLGTSRPLVGFSVREPGPAAPKIDPDHYHALLAASGDYVVERLGADAVFVPIERRNQDLQHSHAVVSKMQRAERAVVLKGEYSPGQLIALMQRFEFALGMRLHFLVFAALAGVPFVALPYAAKVRGFVEEFELEVAPMEDGGAGRLIAHLDAAWDHRDSIRRAVGRTLPGLQERARETARIALSLLRGDDRAEPETT